MTNVITDIRITYNSLKSNETVGAEARDYATWFESELMELQAPYFERQQRLIEKHLEIQRRLKQNMNIEEVLQSIRSGAFKMYYYPYNATVKVLRIGVS